MHRTEAFPVVVWIKRVLSEYFPDGFPVFAGDIAGYATTYCIFTYNQDSNFGDPVVNYDQLNSFHSFGTKESGAQDKLNDTDLDYDDVW